MKAFPALLTLTSLSALAAGAGAQTAAHQTPLGPGGVTDLELTGPTAYAPGQVIVRFASGPDASVILEGLDPERYVVEQVVYRRLDAYLIRIVDETTVADAIRFFRSREGVVTAQADHYTAERVITTPNDTSFGTMWGLNNTGQSGGTVDADIDAVEAWDLGTGSSDFVVAVVDGGCELSHSDLSPNLWVNSAENGGTPGVDDDGNGYVDDVNGWDAYANDGSIPSSFHGTHVNGTVGARGNNAQGVTGVNWEVGLMPIAGSSSSTSTVLIAYGYAADQKDLWLTSGGTGGANVVATNSSFGIDFADCTSGSYPMWDAAYDDMGALGILSCAATINSSQDVDVIGDVPTGCGSDWLISVTNMDRNDNRAFAGFGATTIDLGAPGSSVLSTATGGGYTTLSGTSMATPHVAGSVAWLHSVGSTALQALVSSDPGGAALVIKDIILDNVDPLAGLNGLTTSGGRLNLHSSGLAAVGYNAVIGAITPYGLGLGGSNIGTLSSTDTPNQGTSIVLKTTNIPNGTIGAMSISTASGSFGILGGTLLIDPSMIVFQAPFTLAGGAANSTVPLPPGTAGITVYATSGAFDPTQTSNVAFTNGVQIDVGG